MHSGATSVIAFDRTKPKIDSIRRLSDKLRLNNVSPLVLNAEVACSSNGLSRKELRAFASSVSAESHTGPAPRFQPGVFDRILLDPSCSALGLRPHLRIQKSISDIENNHNYQRRLLSAAYELLRPGGTLVYSTCTISPGENEGIVAHALERYPDLQVVPMGKFHLGGRGIMKTDLDEILRKSGVKNERPISSTNANGEDHYSSDFGIHQKDSSHGDGGGGVFKEVDYLKESVAEHVQRIDPG
eukprot:CAMPEP_0184363116 /NCGR_PEP_ID=MMETSP1089-20130417/138182_1 /TAXON_ID=38269 ORGANISM="Gloeochaete wittrockiana, Strain SAG46.84" /NCGR_SAMPLE_ID=MMETSP1089 /ASSEMBLY_ACC=CAM_ASM_000445 /LENGTH=242 /DNA_ID=CAMNT_0026703485 /DNA_START=1 /DNA_END=726 /DNA_ORIENTATION=+